MPSRYNPESLRKGDMMKNRSKLGTVAVIGLWLAIQPVRAGLFTVGPDYRTPTNSSPSNYKAMELGSWKEGKPLDQVPKGNWWEVFNDPELDQLEAEAAQANQNLKAAVARVSEARATARVARG